MTLVEGNISNIQFYGFVIFNHFLKYTNDSTMWTGSDNNWNYYEYGSIQYRNYYNTTLLFSNSRVLKTIPNYSIMYYMVLYSTLL